MRKHAPADFTVTLAALRDATGLRDMDAVLGNEPPDLVLSLDTTQAARVRQGLTTRGWRAKLIGSWNIGWPYRFPRLYERYRHVDHLIFNNREYWERAGRWPDTSLLPNGVDLDLFRVTRPIETRRPRVLWTGSTLYRQLKGYDELIVPLRRRLEARGIECDLWLVDPFGPERRTPEQMAEWYNSGTILVCASATEGTPNPALEAAACGCVIVSTRVGNMPELIRDGVNGYLVARDLEALVEAVTVASARYPAAAREMLRDIQAWGWAERSRPYFAQLRELAGGGDDHAAAPPRARRRPSYFDEVTVFVTTVGAPTFQACLEHLGTQDCTFRLEILEGVAPLSAALQRMVDACTTPMYVQVDEDMLLHPHTISTLRERIGDAGPATAMVVGGLYDVHLERGIAGVKIFRHDAVRGHQLEGLPDWVTGLQQRLADAGYTMLRLPLTDEGVLGLHGTAWTPEAIYERYANLTRRWRARAGHLDWFAPYPSRFFQRFLDDPSETNFFALMGVVAGVLDGSPGAGREKDFRAYGRLPGFEALREFLDQMNERRRAQ